MEKTKTAANFAPKRTKRLSETKHIRFAAGELAFIEAIAERENSTFSDVVRRMIRSEADLIPMVDNALRPEIQAMNEQLRKVGINLNQAVRAMNEGRVNYQEDLERALIAVGLLVVEQRNDLREALKRPKKPRASAK
ncbi:hypothetical protein HGO37_26070 [Rhizobium sp. CG4]|uniref:hypothetical protein n=1 Tax=Rhizobium sp. CG4 TaxID=2726075 RepID=UPI002033EBDE|nr:hypothetical protein [Rhizobium sp. CG4]MCM2458851.1 hypothetical protein [Rhizobium sp. CG4]